MADPTEQSHQKAVLEQMRASDPTFRFAEFMRGLPPDMPMGGAGRFASPTSLSPSLPLQLQRVIEEHMKTAPIGGEGRFTPPQPMPAPKHDSKTQMLIDMLSAGGFRGTLP